jgi:hypothetical protein
MKECVWVKPSLVAEIEFLEWTGADHLRHTKFLRLRDDKDPRKILKDTRGNGTLSVLAQSSMVCVAVGSGYQARPGAGERCGSCHLNVIGETPQAIWACSCTNALASSRLSLRPGTDCAPIRQLASFIL